MSDPRMIRVWQGWRRDPLADAADWKTFLDRLGSQFIPQTWKVMTRFGLQVYSPTVLQPMVDGLPEEVALLIYSSEAAYLEHKQDPEGIAYSASHADIFGFPKGPQRSRSGIAVDVGEVRAKYGTPVHRAAVSGTEALESDKCVLELAVLSKAHAKDAVGVLSALQKIGGEMVFLIEDRYTLLWIASDGGLDRAAVEVALTGLFDVAPQIAWYQAERASLKSTSGFKVIDGSSLYFKQD
ncbi:MAG: hypothetical protein LCH73_01040 [Proteobacteria bacterium]|nr:hypothetical protein [Pseudomonadota bacterium]